MQIEIKIDESCKEPRAIIITDKMTPEINIVLQRLSESDPQVILGFCEDTATILDESNLYRIFSTNGKVTAVTAQGEYTLRLRLYEAEQRLCKGSFVRISHSEIVNLKKVTSFDLSLAGTICMKLRDGTVSYVSRRYVPKIKQILGL